MRTGSSFAARALSRIGATVAIVAVALALSAAPAAAHSVGGVGSTNYVSRVTAIEPKLPGVAATIVEAGGRLLLTSKTSEVTVTGYQSEPYLRIGPRGVYENVRSPAVYLNRTRQATDTGSGRADPDAAPEWHRVGDGPSYAWHDHNIHWMGQTDPPVVQSARGTYHLLFGPGGTVSQDPWKVQVTAADGTKATILGTLEWSPGPSSLPWLVIAAGLVAVSAVVGATRRWAPLLGGLIAIALAFDVVHGIGIALDYSASPPTQIAKFVSGSAYGIAGWIIAAFGVKLLARRSIDGLYATIFGGLSIALFGGLLDISYLSKTEIPFALGTGLARASVTVALGLGIGAAAGALVAIKRNPEVQLDLLLDENANGGNANDPAETAAELAAERPAGVLDA